MFIPVNLKYTFSLKHYEETTKDLRKRIKKKMKKKAKRLKRRLKEEEMRKQKRIEFRPLHIFAGLMATIIMIPVNFFLCARDSYKGTYRKK